MLRSTGVRWDIRKAKPYDAYSEMDFNIVVGSNGDIYDRYLSFSLCYLFAIILYIYIIFVDIL